MTVATALAVSWKPFTNSKPSATSSAITSTTNGKSHPKKSTSGTDHKAARKGGGLEEIALGQEAAHSHHRILHADGDATGRELIRCLLSHAAATSFYPGKNLGAYGDAGAVVTDSDDLAGRMRMIADHGTRRKYEHEVFGFNSRLDTLQAVVLSAKLRRLAGWNASRRAAADRYHELLSGVDEVVRPRTLAGNEHDALRVEHAVKPLP